MSFWKALAVELGLIQPDVLKSAPHLHENEQGVLVKCYHKSRAVLFDSAFWIGVTLSFPLEHFLWEKVWPFYVISEWMGL